MIIVMSISCYKSDKNEVYFIPTLHGSHQINRNYSYDSLKAVIVRLNPDIIAVEIRPEDLNQDSLYLSKSYPYEMVNAKYWFPNKKIVGFDWYGEDVEGKLIPDNYWENNPMKKLQQQLSKDSLYKEKLDICNSRWKERANIFRTYSLKQLLESEDEIIVNDYYNCLNIQFKGTPYEPIFNFFKERDQHIIYNIRNILKQNKNARIVILTGDDHYQMLKDSIPHSIIY